MEYSTKAWIELMPIVQDRGWRIGYQNQIVDRDGRCPLCALIYELSNHEVDHHFDPWSAADDFLGGHEGFCINPVVEIAHNPLSPRRDMLMQMLGMK